MVAWNGMDRRRFPRVSFPCLITVKESKEGKDHLLTHTENVGVGGVCIVVKKEFKMFMPVTLELDLLDGDEHVKCSAKVVWSIRRRVDEQDKPAFFDIGIEFIDLETKDLNRLEIIIQRLVKSGKTVPYR